MQAPIPVDFDISPYMETTGAPHVLWKKGIFFGFILTILQG
jgi:hypothetical protein